ncbi:arginase family protein [Paenibacillus sp. LHD-117]|uniref:arginase family protein n=1 Tax=Paenibacillus sp. LHD-117 TaxID=3071412 RepID=UPI0027E020AE|nr:arginase family protein [Paenibacillus sp. LHD-117]MDQ6420496.1 arginase family protein [Paenibacillus sp. LHD-117]
MIENNNNRTLRLLFPQWQGGGNNPPYILGAHLLNWLAPKAEGPFEEVPVSLNLDEEKEHGIMARGTVLKQARSAKELIQKHNPDRIVVLGGDCSVELAPFAYLNEKYDGDTALLWVDAHPDVYIPEDFPNHHAMVLANLLGVGDKEFVAEVPRFFKPEQVLFVGLNDLLESLNSEPLRNMKLDSLGPDEIKQDSSKVLQWLDERKPSKIMIHFDLDVLDMTEFRSLLVAYPETYEEYKDKFPRGVRMETIIRILQDVAKSYDVVGLGITEHFPWDSYFLQNMLSRLPLIGDVNKTERPKYNPL